MLIRLLVFFISGYFILSDALQAVGLTLFFELLFRLIKFSNRQFVFREWVMVLYTLNYVVSPMITYRLDDSLVKYGMKIPPDSYFILSIPGMLFFYLGLYTIRTNIFVVDFSLVKKGATINEAFLFMATLLGVLLRLLNEVIQIGELSFLIYLASLIRFEIGRAHV